MVLGLAMNDAMPKNPVRSQAHASLVSMVLFRPMQLSRYTYIGVIVCPLISSFPWGVDCLSVTACGPSNAATLFCAKEVTRNGGEGQVADFHKRAYPERP